MALLQVLQKSYFFQSFINNEFVIDDTLGRDVKFAIDTLSGIPTEVSIFYSNGTLLFNRNGGIYDRTFVNYFPMLKVQQINHCAEIGSKSTKVSKLGVLRN